MFPISNLFFLLIVTQSQPGNPFFVSIQNKAPSCSKSFLMAKKESRKRGIQTASSSENSEDTVIQTMVDHAIFGALPYRPRVTSGPPTPEPASPSSTHDPPQPQNIVHAFAAYFGNENDLRNWQRLCQDLGITEELNSKTQCRKVRVYASLTTKSGHD
jgi:hypothetical protein